jgi:hypothetical protein
VPPDSVMVANRSRSRTYTGQRVKGLVESSEYFEKIVTTALTISSISSRVCSSETCSAVDPIRLATSSKRMVAYVSVSFTTTLRRRFCKQRRMSPRLRSCKKATVSGQIRPTTGISYLQKKLCMAFDEVANLALFQPLKSLRKLVVGRSGSSDSIGNSRGCIFGDLRCLRNESISNRRYEIMNTATAYPPLMQELNKNELFVRVDLNGTRCCSRCADGLREGISVSSTARKAPQ